jgi:cation/acetate symporter
MGMQWEGKSFIDNLPKIYGVYTGGFLAFFALMAVLERFGLGADTIGILFIAFTIGIYAFIGILSRTMAVEAYYVAGRSVPPVFNGMATAADWMSGASFVAMAGGIFMAGHGYMAFIVGWTGGYILVATLMAPYLRKFGCYTVPDFIGTRYGGKTARLAAVLVLVVASFTYVTAQITATGTIAARALQIPFEVGVWFGLAGILVCSMLGGMRAVTWTQVAQYIVLIIAYLIPIFWMSGTQGFGWLPQLQYGPAVARIMELETIIGVGTPPVEAVPGLSALTTLHATPREGALAAWQFVTLVACMMIGTASLPHILMRYFTTPSVRAARNSVAWSLFFIFLLYFSAPALATFSKLQMIDPNLTDVDHRRLDRVGAGARVDPEMERHRTARGGGSQRRRHPADQRVLPQPRYHRAGHAGNCRPAVRDLGPGGCGRHGGRHVHRRRPAAGHGQRPVA